MNIPKIKMLILDVDGTMTDNGIYIDENGVESKRYNAKDGVGIYELIKNNIKIGIISHSEKGDGIKSRASYLGIKYCYVGNEPKDKILLEMSLIHISRSRRRLRCRSRWSQYH